MAQQTSTALGGRAAGGFVHQTGFALHAAQLSLTRLARARATIRIHGAERSVLEADVIEPSAARHALQVELALSLLVPRPQIEPTTIVGRSAHRTDVIPDMADVALGAAPHGIAADPKGSPFGFVARHIARARKG